MSLELEYFYGNEAERYSFYRIPKVLFKDYRYKSVSMEAKVLYGLMLDRMGLSVKNGWMDSADRVYIYFTQEEAMDAMQCGKDKITRLFRELDQNGIGLIERRKQGQGRPARVYVKNFVLSLEPEPPEPNQSPLDDTPQTADKKQSRPRTEAAVKNAQKTQSGGSKKSGQDSAFCAPNNTEKNNTDWSDTESSSSPIPPTPLGQRPVVDRQGQMETYRTVLQENICYEILFRDYGCDPEMLDGCVELMAEVCASTKETIRVNQEYMPIELVRSRFLKLDMAHIAYVLDYLSRNATPVGNIRGYMLSVLYNAPMTIGHYYAAQVSHDMARGREVRT